MCKENALINLEFEGRKLDYIIGEDGEPLFEIYNVGMMLGYHTKNGADAGIDYPRKKRIDNVIKKANIEPCFHCGNKYLTEEMVYDFMLEAHTEPCKRFKKWLSKEVLPSIRKHGAYIGENADENYVNNEMIFGNKTTIKTFANADPAMVNKLYSEFKEYINTEYKNNTNVRKSRYLSVEKGLNRLLENIGTNAENIGLCYNIQVLIKKVSSDIKTLGNRINGGKRAGLTRANKKLKNELDEANNNILQKEKELLDIKEKYDPNNFWTVLDYHPFSVNYMYDNNQITSSYQRWIDNFPKQQLHSKEEYEKRANIDFSKPIVIYIKYRNLPKFDTDNLSKSLIDYLFNRYFLVDDSIVKGKVEFTKKHCDSYKDGKIKFTLRNMTEDEINRLND